MESTSCRRENGSNVLSEDFVIVPTNQRVPTDVTFICNHFFDLNVIWKLNLDCPFSNQANI